MTRLTGRPGLLVGPMVAVAVLVGLAGCVSAPAVTGTAAGVGTTSAASSAPAPSPSATSSAAPVTCDNATVSYAPETSSAYASQIKSRGYLLVGVSADTRQLGAVDPADPNTFEGFDIDMAQLVAKQIWGTADKRVRFKVISTADRIPQLQAAVNTTNNADGGVDLVARAFTMTCARWQQVAFSSVYFTAEQRLLVPNDSKITSAAGLTGKTVCAPRGSTSLVNIAKANGDAKLVDVAAHTDCLVRLQQGLVDAITGDDAILAGFENQDPGTKVVGPAIGKEPYGLGINVKHKDFKDFAAYVNSVLDKARADGSWQASYDRWLKPALGARTPPVPQYGRT
jgi:polar amino acid transport system substrate-binding protein